MSNKKSNTTVVSYKTVLDTRAKTPLPAAARLRRGKNLIAVGTIIAILGIAVYSTTMLIGDMNSEPVKFLGEGLILIGTGLAVWVIGAIKYLNAAIDIGYTDDSI
ncbi:MAG: hypothetical protein HYS17_06950 [Micavibrio aeruginosavorus]|uniref:Uncharacterized protein n=1 Tax=Micavibrio aeruginosavorus TaxID=349221 RepID=A0A7T5R0N1_9BACT|nr:MAG: hypothetical protein HYS17_06950 [Micavibrio aeruginosavorus]